MEHLRVFARLGSGAYVGSEADFDRFAHDLLNSVGLAPSDHIGKQSQNFSGGMKRKLSLALAACTRPSLLLVIF